MEIEASVGKWWERLECVDSNNTASGVPRYVGEQSATHNTSNENCVVHLGRTNVLHVEH
jgi:hypothetical protein